MYVIKEYNILGNFDFLYSDLFVMLLCNLSVFVVGLSTCGTDARDGYRHATQEYNKELFIQNQNQAKKQGTVLGKKEKKWV